MKENKTKKNKPPIPLICFGISFYNDSVGLGRCLDSIFSFSSSSVNNNNNNNNNRRFIIKVLALDGKYTGYPAKSALSNDGSREKIGKFQRKYGMGRLELHDYPGLYQREKRQIYVDLAARYNATFLLIMDADEYLDVKSTNWHKFMRELMIFHRYEAGKTLKGSNVLGVRFIDFDQNGYTCYRPRLWYRPEQMHYTDKHYNIKRRDSDSLMTANMCVNVPDSLITIAHDSKGCRTKKRMQKRDDYQLLYEGIER